MPKTALEALLYTMADMQRTVALDNMAPFERACRNHHLQLQAWAPICAVIPQNKNYLPTMRVDTLAHVPADKLKDRETSNKLIDTSVVEDHVRLLEWQITHNLDTPEDYGNLMKLQPSSSNENLDKYDSFIIALFKAMLIHNRDLNDARVAALQPDKFHLLNRNVLLEGLLPFGFSFSAETSTLISPRSRYLAIGLSGLEWNQLLIPFENKYPACANLLKSDYKLEPVIRPAEAWSDDCLTDPTSLTKAFLGWVENLLELTLPVKPLHGSYYQDNLNLVASYFLSFYQDTSESQKIALLQKLSTPLQVGYNATTRQDRINQAAILYFCHRLSLLPQSFELKCEMLYAISKVLLHKLIDSAFPNLAKYEDKENYSNYLLLLEQTMMTMNDTERHKATQALLTFFAEVYLKNYGVDLVACAYKTHLLRICAELAKNPLYNYPALFIPIIEMITKNPIILSIEPGTYIFVGDDFEQEQQDKINKIYQQTLGLLHYWVFSSPEKNNVQPGHKVTVMQLGDHLSFNNRAALVKMAAQKISATTAIKNSALPAMLALLIESKSETQQQRIREAHAQFEKIFCAMQTEHYGDFLFRHQPRLCQLVSIMQEDALVLLERQLRTSHVALNSLLDSISLLPELLVAVFKSMYDKEKDSLQQNEALLDLWWRLLIDAGKRFWNKGDSQPFIEMYQASEKKSKKLSEFDCHLTETNSSLAKREMPVTAVLLSIYISYFPEEQQPSLQEAFVKFERTFIKINSKVKDAAQHARNYGDFITQYHIKICQLIRIMREDAFKFLISYMAHTVLALERELDRMRFLPPSLVHFFEKLYRQFPDTTSNKSQTLRRWGESLIKVGMILDTLSDEQKVMALCQAASAKATNLNDFDNYLNAALIMQNLEALHLSEDQVTADYLLQYISPNEFAKLFAALMRIKNSEYDEIFKAMLCRDFLSQSITTLLRDNTQSHTVGMTLAKHNTAIHQYLAHHKINVALALHYPDKLHLRYATTNSIATPSDSREKMALQKQELDAYLDQLVLVVADIQKTMPEDIQRKLSDLQRHVGIIKNAKIESIIHNPSLKKIEGLLNWLIGYSDHHDRILGANFMEFASHTIKSIAEISEASNANLMVPEKKTEQALTFRVEQWDKNNIRTFFLGDDVGCCLATNGAYFEAMVQRRMDDAMFFHVVMDEATQRPAALTWLYFATPKRSPNEIYVVANFIEIASRYSSDTAMSQMIINALLKYTEEFSQKIGAKGFLMNSLDYGLVSKITDLSIFEMRVFALEKCGGSLNVSRSSSSYNTIENRYYLASLDKDYLYVYDFNKLTASAKQALAEAIKRLDVEDKRKTATLAGQGLFAKKKILARDDIQLPAPALISAENKLLFK